MLFSFQTKEVNLIYSVNKYMKSKLYCTQRSKHCEGDIVTVVHFVMFFIQYI